MKEIYKEQLFKIPTPKFYVLYNGEKELKQDVLRLSDAFMLSGGDFTLELTVKVLNVNYDSGCDILDKSPSLKGYAYLIELIRQHQKAGLSRDKSIKPAIKQCIEENILADFLQEHFEEVANMLAREYSFEEEIEARMEEAEEKGMAKGIEKGIEKGVDKGIIESAKKLLRIGMPLAQVVAALELSDDHTRQLEGVVI